MAGSSNISGDQSIYFTDNLSFDGTYRGGALSADGELWIGSSTSNRANNGGHVRKGTLTAGAGVTITNAPGAITIGLEASPSNFAELKWKASDFDAVETNFAPINTDTGANAIETVRSFDDTTEEFVNFSFIAPTTMTTGTVTFRAYGYAATAAASRFVELRFGHTALAASDSWDQTYTNVDSGDAAVDPTQDDITVVEWTETVANLGWTAEDLVIARLSRIAPAGTNLTGDFQLISLAIEVPITAVAGGGGGGGGVQSVSGTANRITSTGGTNPIINIDPAFVGQTAITTLGTITTGTWNATTIAPTVGGTGLTTYTTGDILYASAANTLSKLAIGTAGQVLTVAGGLPSWSSAALITWVEETGATRNLTINQGVVGNRGTAQTFTLPATAAQFSEIRIVQIGAGAITIDWTTSQQVRFGNQLATTTTGTLVSTDVGSTLYLLCTTADNIWTVVSSTGSWTIT